MSPQLKGAITRRMAARFCLALAAAPLRPLGAETPANTPATAGVNAKVSLRFRLVMSENMLSTDVNEGDAKLAIEAWRAAVVKQSGFLIDIEILPLAKLIHAVQQHQADGFSTTLIEYPEVESYASRYLVMDEGSAQGGDEYLLLAHEDSGIKSLAELHRKSLNVFDHPKMCLASLWLDTVFAASNLGSPQEFFVRTSSQTKLSRVVLPVYFRQTDACLVTHRGFATMCELNPQLERKLKVVASSPKLIPTVMAFHRELTADRRQVLLSAILGLSKTAAGQQALMLFETSQLVAGDTSALKNSLDLLKAHEQLRAKAAVRKK